MIEIDIFDGRVFPGAAHIRTVYVMLPNGTEQNIVVSLTNILWFYCFIKMKWIATWIVCPPCPATNGIHHRRNRQTMTSSFSARANLSNRLWLLDGHLQGHGKWMMKKVILSFVSRCEMSQGTFDQHRGTWNLFRRKIQLVQVYIDWASNWQLLTLQCNHKNPLLSSMTTTTTTKKQQIALHAQSTTKKKEEEEERTK